jgi:adenosylcobinamide-phosphate synthase
MMTSGIDIGYQVLIALTLDLLAGDPRWFPHPVKIIGRFAISLEEPFRKTLRNQRLAGIMAALTTIAAAVATTYGALRGALIIHPLLAEIVSILILYTCFAARDLAGHAMAVYSSLKNNDLTDARLKVSFLVGRDTDQLDEAAITRATVESVAENTVDGVIAPLFFAILGGPVAAIVYKSVSTLDSTFGYKNSRYVEFGWASARLDDLFNYLPARLTALIIPVAAAVMGMNFLGAFKIMLRDGKKHASPNSGLSEAAFAGALDIQLGGPVTRGGIPSMMPTMGDELRRLVREDIFRAVTIMIVTLLLFSSILIGLRLLIT